MGKTLVSRLAVLAVGGAALLAASGIALAQTGQAEQIEQTTEVFLKEDQKNITADEFGERECDGPFEDLEEDQDGWHFVLTQFDGSTDDVVFELTFEDTEGNQQIVTATGDDLELTGGAVHLWLIVPAGWELKDGKAIVSPPGSVGSNPQFNLSHTCPGVPASPTPPETPTPSGTPTPSPMHPAPGDGAELPTTGNHAAALAVVGMGLLGAGLGALMVRRRRGSVAS